MTQSLCTYSGGPIFDGHGLRDGYAAQFRDGCLVALVPEAETGARGEEVDLGGDILSPGYVDLQVNGGGGVMLNDAPSLEDIQRITAAHRSLGATTILPTLITDTAEKTAATLAAGVAAAQAGVRGFGGLHLEGPHLSVARKGAHDAALIRPMEVSDLERVCAAAPQLPKLKMTIAPESVTVAQVRQLVAAGVLVSLGHTDAPFETCVAYVEAGARCATHLFNAMSQLGNRAPGLVGAVLERGDLSAGIIADGIHVHPATLRAAWVAKRRGAGQIFLVSDAMAVAGTTDSEFELEGRKITRRAGRLCLADGTLAGADLDLTTALAVLTGQCGVALTEALAAATRIPAGLIGRSIDLGRPGYPLADMIRIRSDLSAATPLIA
ncbi:N-acetylglucosamine-6-phosphate deacetylase [Tritonibacter horizontis]|uniref:N-acetylglucosamine-6-phosphate deacetylase n=1 Tax=Tritonibacter horizontis TaxID=1768241 RepID=A0A132BSU2_9RHOB|nr:N-acetylglucosamine-6-phosphate deacetylase [Tritonibacter horizontis]KUP91441.1 N-acetylglucosamine-6-phosphate deacetylase [Tritonibacter horizontis]